MPRNPKFGSPVSVYLAVGDSSGNGGWQEYRKLCDQKYNVSGSYRLNELMLKDMAEMKGQTLPNQQNVTDLELKLATLLTRRKKLGMFLAKTRVYKPLEKLVIGWKIDSDTFKNLDVIISKLLAYEPTVRDGFSKDDIELFIQLLKINLEKYLLKRLLDSLRLNKAEDTFSSAPNGADKETDCNAKTSSTLTNSKTKQTNEANENS
jgi:hypothetical protein